MKMNNQNILNKIFEICERDGSITKVSRKYYVNFTEYSDEEMEAVIYCIVCDRIETINGKILSSKWNTGQEIYDFVFLFLDMLARGILGFREKDLKLVFSKPVGDPPDEEMECKIESKIKSTKPLIDKVLYKMLPDSKESPR